MVQLSPSFTQSRSYVFETQTTKVKDLQLCIQGLSDVVKIVYIFTAVIFIQVEFMFKVCAFYYRQTKLTKGKFL